MKDLKWRKVEDLPIEEEQYRKVLILSEGRLSGSTSLFISTDYWNVFFDDININLNIFNKRKKISDNCFSYGKFEEGKIPFDKIKGWMYADELIGLYHG